MFDCRIEDIFGKIAVVKHKTARTTYMICLIEECDDEGAIVFDGMKFGEQYQGVWQRDIVAVDDRFVYVDWYSGTKP